MTSHQAPRTDRKPANHLVIYVTGSHYHSSDSAQVMIWGLDPISFGSIIDPIDFGDSISRPIRTYRSWCTGDTTDRILVEVRSPSSVPSIDTFFISSTQPQFIHIRLEDDTGFINGSLSFMVNDTSGNPIPEVELEATWYPGPSWNSMWHITAHSDDSGHIMPRTFIVDSLRNAIIANFSKYGYKTFVDTLVIMNDTLRNINIILKKE